MSEQKGGGLRPAAVTAVAIVLCVASLWLVYPGIDLAELRRIAAPEVWGPRRFAAALSWFQLRASLAPVAGALPVLVCVRAVLALLAPGPVADAAREAPYREPAERDVPQAPANRRAARVALGLFLALCALKGLATMLYLETVRDVGLVESVAGEPGWGHRLVAMAAGVAAGAWVWGLASWVTRRGAGHGALLLFAAGALLDAGVELLRLGTDVAAGAVWPRAALRFLLDVLPVVIVLLALARRRPAYPLRVRRGAALRSPLDALALPAAVATALYDVVATLRMVSPAHPALRWVRAPWVTDLRTGLAICAALALAFVLRRAARRARTGWGYVLAAPAFALGAAVLVVQGIRGTTGSVPAWVTHGLTHGGYHYALELRCADGDGAADAPTIAARLRSLGLRAEVRAARAGHIHLGVVSLHEVPPAAIDRAIQRHQLRMHWTDADQSAIAVPPDDPAGASPPAQSDTITVMTGPERERRTFRVYAAPSAGSLRPLLARLQAPPQRALAVECTAWSAEPPALPCHPLVLVAPPFVTGRDVASAEVRIREDTNEPFVALEFTPRGRERFGAETAAHVNDQLAIVVDGEVVSRPVVNEPIRNGRAQITLGRTRNVREALATAAEWAAAFSGELDAVWERAALVSE